MRPLPKVQPKTLKLVGTKVKPRKIVFDKPRNVVNLGLASHPNATIPFFSTTPTSQPITAIALTSTVSDTRYLLWEDHERAATHR